ADRARRLEIARPVADERLPGERHPELGLDSAQQRGLRLAALAAGVRMVRAVVDARELSTRRFYRRAHPHVNRRERRHGVKPAADSRLIRDDGDAYARAVQPRDRVEASRYRAPLVGRLDELVRVLVDHAVAIEHDEPR